jgi:hypothetical protein
MDISSVLFKPSTDCCREGCSGREMAAGGTGARQSRKQKDRREAGLFQILFRRMLSSGGYQYFEIAGPPQR